jgi:hypothetical protein
VQLVIITMYGHMYDPLIMPTCVCVLEGHLFGFQQRTKPRATHTDLHTECNPSMVLCLWSNTGPHCTVNQKKTRFRGLTLLRLGQMGGKRGLSSGYELHGRGSRRRRCRVESYPASFAFFYRRAVQPLAFGVSSFWPFSRRGILYCPGAAHCPKSCI